MNKLLALTAANAAGVALALSDGTPVEFVKVTKKDNIQVRVPTDHDELGDDPLRIFRRDGSHYKDQTDLTLTVVSTAADAPATAAAQKSTVSDNVTYLVAGTTFASKEDAIAEAMDIFRDTDTSVEVFETRLIGRVGFTALAA